MDARQTQAIFTELLREVSHDLVLWLTAQRDLGAINAPADDPEWPDALTTVRKNDPVIMQTPPKINMTNAMPVSQHHENSSPDKPCSCAFSTFDSLRRENKMPVPQTLEERKTALSLLNAHMSACHCCLLGTKRRAVLTGRGPLDPLMMFVAAGANPAEIDSDKFLSGKAADLMDNMIHGMTKCISEKITGDHIYMTNVIKCACLAPVKKRNDIAGCCLKWLREEIAIVRPQVIIIWGEFAYHAMFGGRIGISQVRGQWKSFDGIPAMPTHHPMEMLKNAELKKRVWPDLQEACKALKL